MNPHNPTSESGLAQRSESSRVLPSGPDTPGQNFGVRPSTFSQRHPTISALSGAVLAALTQAGCSFYVGHEQHVTTALGADVQVGGPELEPKDGSGRVLRKGHTTVNNARNQLEIDCSPDTLEVHGPTVSAIRVGTGDKVAIVNGDAFICRD